MASVRSSSKVRSQKMTERTNDDIKRMGGGGSSGGKQSMSMPTTNFKAETVDSKKQVNAAAAASNSSFMTRFAGGKKSLLTSSIGGGRGGGGGASSQVQMEGGKKILRALSAFACISLKTSSSPGSSARNSAADVQDALQETEVAGEEKQKKAEQADQRILLRIVMWGGPNTLLLLAPFNAPAECVIEMVLDSYLNGVGMQECHDFELFCAHCNSPALHPKQPIGTVGSRHFLLCKKVPQLTGLGFFNSQSQIAQASQFYYSGQVHHGGGSKHHFGSRHKRSLSHGTPSLSQLSSILSHSSHHHKRSNSWWNPVQCLTVQP